MRNFCFIAAIAAAFATPVHASPLPFRATLDIAFGGFAFVTIEGTGVAEVGATGASLTQLSLPADVFSITTEFPGTFPLGGLAITAQNGAGAFTDLTARSR
jgi:hypothetical protein